jgi:hypothetical protein
MFNHMGPGTNNTHVPYQNINKLGKLIKACSSQKLSNLCNTNIVFGCLINICILIDFHAPELIAQKALSVFTCPKL